MGAFVLYAQSYFGIWSIIGIIGITISSEIIYRKINKINKERDQIICVLESQGEAPSTINEAEKPTEEAPAETNEKEEDIKDEK